MNDKPVSTDLGIVSDEELQVRVLYDSIADPPQQGEVHGLANGAQDGVDGLGTGITEVSITMTKFTFESLLPRIIPVVQEGVDGGDEGASPQPPAGLHQRQQQLHPVGGLQRPH